MRSFILSSCHLSLLAFILGVFFFQGCLSATDTGIEEEEYNPDFSTVPEPFDTTGTLKTELDNGVIYYTIRQGEGIFQVVYRDQLSLYFTLRTANGRILSSSYADSSTSPRLVRVADLTTQGMISGILGMKVKEQRTLVVPPAMGYGGVSETDPNYEFRNDTLIYDLEVSYISQ